MSFFVFCGVFFFGFWPDRQSPGSLPLDYWLMVAVPSKFIVTSRIT